MPQIVEYRAPVLRNQMGSMVANYVADRGYRDATYVVAKAKEWHGGKPQLRKQPTFVLPHRTNIVLRRPPKQRRYKKKKYSRRKK